MLSGFAKHHFSTERDERPRRARSVRTRATRAMTEQKDIALVSWQMHRNAGLFLVVGIAAANFGE